MPAPTQLGRYQIETPLGSGAFADVYRASDQMLKRTVALKVLKPALVADGEAFGRFVQEAQVAANLFHPHIATVLDMGEAEGRYFIAMRYVDGPSLDKVLAADGPLPWAQALEIASQIGQALDFAHQKGLVHRDVKPQNIIISASEGAVLTDFGLVRAIATSGLTHTGSMLGTPAYMAPEIWEGEEAAPATDQYALACVLVEMLTGKVLFDGKTPPAVMAKHFKPLALPTTWPQGVPVGIGETLGKALAKTPAERFAKNAAFIAALHQPFDTVSPVKASSAHTQQSAIQNPAGIEWVEIPAGEFLYGDKNERRSIEKPFLIGKYPVTNAQYKRFVDANPKYAVPQDWDQTKRIYLSGKANHPVIYVSWNDAQAFCQWAKCRLPTETEWEKAARGIDGRKYPWGDGWVSGKYCNSVEAKNGGTTPVDGYPDGVSPYGVWDLSGNVWEWTASRHEAGEYYVLRGGSWCGYDLGVRSALRGLFTPSYTGNGSRGFRCACSHQP
ncbi:MAG: bifunctional serine/threonine-protein kinase/formylglycine-generating enzyme family protein [Anaerolineales bacterium]